VPGFIFNRAKHLLRGVGISPAAVALRRYRITRTRWNADSTPQKPPLPMSAISAMYLLSLPLIQTRCHILRRTFSAGTTRAIHPRLLGRFLFRAVRVRGGPLPCPSPALL